MKKERLSKILIIIFLIVSSVILLSLYYHSAVRELNSQRQGLPTIDGISVSDSSQVESKINQLIITSDTHKNALRYEQAFDCLWEALRYCDYTERPELKNAVYNELGVMMKIFDQCDAALIYFNKALEYKELMCQQKLVDQIEKRKELFSIAVTQIQKGVYGDAIHTLDQSDQLSSNHSDNQKNYFTNVQRGVVFMHTGKLDQAEEILVESLAYFERIGAHYLVMTYRYMGELKLLQKQYDQAIHYCEKAISMSEIFNTHTDIAYIVYEQLSRAYYGNADFEKSYNMLKISKEIEDKLFNVKIATNVLGIRNKYNDRLASRDLEIKEQEILNHQIQVKLLRTQLVCIISFAAVCLIALSFFFYIRHLSDLQKRKEEKQRTTEDKAHLLGELEYKNKELAGYVLQIIHKEKIISDFVNNNDTTSMISNTQFEKLWSDFNHRFVEINQTFYTLLLERYPSLTPTELKHCALIKLNFSSKEMSQLLNISLESVHTSRHRIRKKLELSRNESLSNFITQIY